MTTCRFCGNALLRVLKENNILWVHTSPSGEIQRIYENRIFWFFAGWVSQLCITIAQYLTQLMDKKQRFISLILLGSQSPTLDGSLTWILVRAGIEACSSGSSWRGNSYISNSKKLGRCPTIPMSYGSFILFHLLKAHKIWLILTQGRTCILGGPLCPKRLGTSELKKTVFNIAWFLSHWKFFKSAISHLSSAKWFCCWHRPQSTNSQTVSGDSACEILLGTFNFRNWIWLPLFLMFIFMIFQVEVIWGNN